MQTHIVPVGFDYDRLIAPLVRDQLDIDRVVLLEGAVGSEANVEYSRNLTEKLEQDYRNCSVPTPSGSSSRTSTTTTPPSSRCTTSSVPSSTTARAGWSTSSPSARYPLGRGCTERRPPEFAGAV